MRQQWCPGRFSSPPQKRPGNEANAVRDRSRGIARAQSAGRACSETAHAPYAQKWRLRNPETPVELAVSPFDSFGEYICSKASSLIDYRVDWCKIHRLQSSVGLKKKKKLHHKYFWPRCYITLRNNCNCICILRMLKSVLRLRTYIHIQK